MCLPAERVPGRKGACGSKSGDAMTNNCKFYIRNAAYFMALYLVSGAVLQTCLLDAGVSSARVGVYTSACSAVNILVSVVFAQLSDRTKRLIPWFIFLMLALAGASLLFLFVYRLGFALILLLGAVQTVLVALKNLFEFKLPYHVLDMREYNSVQARDGIITGIVGVAGGALFSRALDAFEVQRVMCGGFAAAVVLFCGCAVLNRLFAVHPAPAVPQAAEPAAGERAPGLRQVLGMPCFYRLLLPNFLRGILMGVTGIITVIGVSLYGMTPAQAAVIPIVCTAANISGSLVYHLLSKRVPVDKVLLLASVITLIFPLCAVCTAEAALGRAVFYGVSFAVSFGIIMISYAVPYMVYGMIPYRVAGAYNTYRMVITTAGSMLAAAAVSALLDRVPVFWLLAAACAAQLASAIAYRREYRKNLQLRTEFGPQQSHT